MTEPLDHLEDGTVRPAADVAEGVSPVESVQNRERSGLVQAVLEGVSREDREAVVLRFFQHLRYGEIAQALGIRETTAKSRVYRAVERLRQLLSERGITAGDVL